MGALISLFISLLMMTVSLTISLTMTFIKLMASLLIRSISQAKSKGSYTTPRRTLGRANQVGKGGNVTLVIIALLIVLAIDRRLALLLALIVIGVWLYRRYSRKGQTLKSSELFRLYQRVGSMSGAQFEVFMAEVFRALGYKATVLGGSGDQGVDILLEADGRRVAVQCKNYNKRVGNKPVQEVFAGARHYGASESWVVAPAGFTKGALELANSTRVSLFDRVGIEAWLKKANMQQMRNEAQANKEQEAPAEQPKPNPGQKEKDRENYWKLLEEYPEYLDHIEELHTIDRKNNPALEQELVKVHQQLIDGVEDLRRKLDILESQNPELVTDKSATQRALLEDRWKRVKDPKGEAIGTENRQKKVSKQQRSSGGQKKDTGDGHIRKHTISVGTATVGETVSFAAKKLGTANVNGGKETKDKKGMDWTYYRLPDHTYRVLIDDGSTRMLLPSNMAEALGRGEPTEYGSWTLEELENEGEYGRVFRLLMEQHPEGRKRAVRDLEENGTQSSGMEIHTISVGTNTLGETVRFTAKKLGTAEVNGGNGDGGMALTVYHLPDNTYRVLAEKEGISLLEPSNFAQVFGTNQSAEYGRWTYEEAAADETYGEMFTKFMEQHPEGRKRNVRNLD